MRVLNQPTMLFDDHEDARRDHDLFDFTEDDFNDEEINAAYYLQGPVYSCPSCDSSPTDEEQAAIRDRIAALIAEVGGQY